MICNVLGDLVICTEPQNIVVSILIYYTMNCYFRMHWGFKRKVISKYVNMKKVSKISMPLLECCFHQDS